MLRDFFCLRSKFAAVTALCFFSLLSRFTGSAHAQTAANIQATPSVVYSPHSQNFSAERWRTLRGLASRRGNTRASAAPHSASATSGVMETLAGAAPFQQPETALTAQLGFITGMAVDAQGNVFVAAFDFRCILKIDTSGNVTVYAGQPLASGPLKALGDNGLATAATLVNPEGLAVDALGNLYIADPGSFTIRKVTAATGIITTIAGTLNQASSNNFMSGIPAVNALLSYPTSVAIDGGGNIFFTDAGEIWRIDQASGLLSQYSETNVTCPALSDTQTCAIANISFGPNYYPGALTIKNGTLYISASSVFSGSTLYTGSILAVDLSTGTTRLLAGGGPEATSPDGNASIGITIDPLGMAVDASGNLDFTNGSGEQVYGAATIMQLPANGTSLTTIAGTGQVGSSGDGGPATAAEILSALSIAATPSGNIIFAESSRIRSISSTGTVTTFAGDGTDNFFGDGGPAQTAGVNAQDSTVDGKGNVYLADDGNGVVRRIDGSTGVITTIAGNGAFADYVQNSSGESEPGDGGPATQTPLGGPVAVTLGAGNNLYIGDFYQGVRVLDLGTGIITTLNSQLNVEGTMAFDGLHTLYAISQQYVYAVDTTTGAATIIAGNGATVYSSDYGPIGDGGPATSAFLYPVGVATDGSGNLYISDDLEQSIRVVNLSTRIISVYAGSGILGELGYSGDGGPASAATFNEVGGLHYDGHGNLLLADRDNHAIREINLASSIVNTVAGNGSPGYSGDGGPATMANMNLPTSGAADASGNLYIADFYNDRIRRVVLQPTPLTASLTTSAANALSGANVTLTATYTGIVYGMTPTGTVTFYAGATALGTAQVAASSGIYTATLTTDALAAAADSITAQFAGDANYAADTSAAVIVTVAESGPLADLSATSLTFAGATDGTTSAAQVVTLSNAGNAALAITSIAASGDFAETNTCGASLAAGASCIISVTFTPTVAGARTGTVTITDNASGSTQTVTLSGGGEAVAVMSTSPSLTIAATGGTATAPIQLSPVDGFTGTVNLTCAVSYLGTGTPNDPPTCSLNPASAQVTGSAPISSTLTITTTAATASAADRSEWRGSAIAFAALVCIGLLPRRRWRAGLLMAALCVVAAAAVIGCGGGSSKGGGSTPVDAGTTTGNYKVVVTATSGTVMSTVTIPIAVQ